jgi:hypothetical protein
MAALGSESTYVAQARVLNAGRFVGSGVSPSSGLFIFFALASLVRARRFSLIRALALANIDRQFLLHFKR